MPATEHALLDHYRALHAGLSEMIETGRLSASEIPDDFDWLELMLSAATEAGDAV